MKALADECEVAAMPVLERGFGRHEKTNREVGTASG